MSKPSTQNVPDNSEQRSIPTPVVLSPNGTVIDRLCHIEILVPKEMARHPILITIADSKGQRVAQERVTARWSWPTATTTAKLRSIVSQSNRVTTQP